MYSKGVCTITYISENNPWGHGPILFRGGKMKKGNMKE
jgi:hypothetical protein